MVSGVNDVEFRYVSRQLGGSVERGGPLGYELPTGYIQLDRKSNLVPIGQLTLGAFQQRALLFKVSGWCWALRDTYSGRVCAESALLIISP